LAARRPASHPRRSAFRAGPPPERTALRDNLEYFAILLLIVLVLRPVVVEAFRIEHGSMAPTLVGAHNEIRCPNCGWTFNVGRDKVAGSGEVECPNCRYHWRGAAGFDEEGRPLSFDGPERFTWVWNSATTAAGEPLDPTNAANRVRRLASRIFVNKFIYHFRRPRRWEVVVFLYPYYSLRCRTCGWRGEVRSLEEAICPDCGGTDFDVTAKSFIKRVVGLPRERIGLLDGDVYVNGRLARKPRHVQEGLWQHVFDSDFMPRQEVKPTWDFGGSAAAWRPNLEGASLILDARGAAEPIMASFGRRIVDFYAYDGLSFEVAPRSIGSAGRAEVGDCRIRARVRVLDGGARGGDVLLGIDDAGRRFRLSVGVGADSAVTLTDGSTVVAEAPAPGLRVGKGEWITLENYDDRVVARLGDAEVLSFEYEARPGAVKGVHFGARGLHVAWDRIVIERDVHYNSVGGPGGGPGTHELGADEYFVLGDNSPSSFDSRQWDEPGVPAENLIGRAFFVFWPVHHMKWLSDGDGGSARR
jgi:signal peptidase I